VKEGVRIFLAPNFRAQGTLTTPLVFVVEVGTIMFFAPGCRILRTPLIIIVVLIIIWICHIGS